MADPENLEVAATEVQLKLSREVIARIRAKHEHDRDSRQVLISFVMRMPVAMRERLREAYAAATEQTNDRWERTRTAGFSQCAFGCRGQGSIAEAENWFAESDVGIGQDSMALRRGTRPE
jgi:hypothetical protein